MPTVELKKTTMMLGDSVIGIYPTQLMVLQLAAVARPLESMQDVIRRAIPVLYRMVIPDGTATGTGEMFDELHQKLDTSRQKIIEHALTALWAQERTKPCTP